MILSNLFRHLHFFCFASCSLTHCLLFNSFQYISGADLWGIFPLVFMILMMMMMMFGHCMHHILLHFKVSFCWLENNRHNEPKDRNKARVAPLYPAWSFVYLSQSLSMISLPVFMVLHLNFLEWNLSASLCRDQSEREGPV